MELDDEARKIIESQYLRAQNLLKEKRKELEVLAQELLDKEVLHRDDVERLIGKRPCDIETIQIDPEIVENLNNPSEENA